MFILQIVKEQLAVFDTTKSLDEPSQLIQSVSELSEFLTKFGTENIGCSSTLDFPEEFTSNPTVIAMANLIRGNR